MTVRRSAYIGNATHELHVSEWGDPSQPFVMMWHGLARNGRDFDEIAAHLSKQYFVVCPDTIGRGLSSWSNNGGEDYNLTVYGENARAIIDHYGAETVRWVGTSMGALVGIRLAAGAMKGRITHLVINDIGPDIPEVARQRIGDYVGNPPVFDTVVEMENWLRKSYAPFGPNPDSFWRRLIDASIRRNDQGRIAVHYDPRIVSQFSDHKADLDVWPQYDAVEAKTLLIRGAVSDVLPEQVSAQMRERGPRPDYVELPGIGHAPTFVDPEQQQMLERFLAS
ncbi:alpha/beta fold hydrolase [Hoeflea prorocentri]|uniref:Alpha/beta hydrolase n=1 Tax=Hoeflea prorocentri TaxID=1922333 RepID=A0A9X3ULZ6_9HYPH|nr:alpha/beta hydrolase [Hoeflea prorocentri]MCY6383006.1 alpha/beta hydrolase [Hoeflea prorocentri]MDA5400806.1 alpha/beta hydrolase [Hoeflea prorocentri]